MIQLEPPTFPTGRRYALCIGIGKYPHLNNGHLKFATTDAETVAQRLRDPQHGRFEVTLKVSEEETRLDELQQTLFEMLYGQDRMADDVVVIYLACRGMMNGGGNFYLLPSDAGLNKETELPNLDTLLDFKSIIKTLTNARVKNVVLFLDVCRTQGAEGALQPIPLAAKADTNIFVMGAAWPDHLANGVRHGVFSDFLLRSLDQNPMHNDGWVTVGEVYRSVAEAMSADKSVQAIEARSTAVNPNLPLVQHLQHSPQSRDFHEQAKELLRLAGYKPSTTTAFDNAPTGFYMTELRAGFGLRKIGVVIYYDKVVPLTPEYALHLATYVREKIREGKMHECLLLTSNEVSSEVRKAIPTRLDGELYLQPMTYNSVLQNLIDFEPYLNKLIAEYEQPNLIPERGDEPPLAQTYIPLKVEYRSYDKQENAVAAKGDLQTWVKAWLANNSKSRLALLADYGSGKSTFCHHLAAQLAHEYLKSDEKNRSNRRIPLLIMLRDFAKNAVDLEGFLVAHLKQHCEVDNPNYLALRKMAEAGLLLFIFDGFDEMALRADSDIVRENMEFFDDFARLPNNKVLVTTRPEYFIDMKEEREILRTYPAFYIQSFDQEQSKLYLQKRVPFLKQQKKDANKDWFYYWNTINQIYDLSDLVRRPVLLEMIVKTLPELVEAGEVVNRPNLYQRYLEKELARQRYAKRRDVLIKHNTRFEIVEQLALELFRSDRPSLTGSQIRDLTKGLLTPDQQNELEASQRDILACSFLIRNGNDYRFSHQSFMEYLTACRLAKDITNNQWEIFLAKPLSKTIRGFLIELEQGIAQKSAESASINGRQVSFDRRKLVSCLEAGWNHRWLNINIVSLLAAMEDFSFANLRLEDLDLSGADLRGLNLRDAKLPRVNLTGANLTDTNLTGAFLAGANLTGANLSRANLIRVNLSGAYLHGADLSNAVVSDANLREAQLIGANLTHTSLARTDLISAYLRSATLSEADLSGAKLIRAELIKANLTGARLSGADLSGVDLSGADLSGANLTGADLDKTEWGEVDLRDGRAGYATGRTICVNVTLDHVKGLSGSLRKKLKLAGALLPS